MSSSTAPVPQPEYTFKIAQSATSPAIRFTLTGKPSFASIRERVEEAYGKESAAQLTYKDADGDMVLLRNDDELREALRTHQAGQVLRFTLYEEKEEEAAVPEEAADVNPQQEKYRQWLATNALRRGLPYGVYGTGVSHLDFLTFTLQ